MKNICYLLFLFLFLGSCAFYHYAKPIYPDSGWPLRVKMVDSLEPTLSWEPEFEGPYDIVILEGYDVMEFSKDYAVMLGMTLGKCTKYYTAQNLAGKSHKITKKLKPNKVYYWVVKQHSDNNSFEWSKYSYFAFYGIGWVYYPNLLFMFGTPNIDDKPVETQQSHPPDG
jgi:hypothetical protein